MTVFMTLVRAKVLAVTYPARPLSKSGLARAIAAIAALNGLAVAAPGCTSGPAASKSRAPEPASAVVDDYEVRVGPDYDLTVVATFGGPERGPLSVDDAAMDYVDGVVAVEGSSRRSVPRGAGGW